MSALATASLVEALLESVLYGVYGVLCITVLYLFCSRERRPAVWVSLGLVIQFFTITGFVESVVDHEPCDIYCNQRVQHRNDIVENMSGYQSAEQTFGPH
ncbi:hypothetical protein GGX14DRAFT_454509 [Mycena pura]|uniref:Uncharacterized protein n=1 Tax=Mycena pura TaxID=153505 RepID=A0AAD6VBB2_9AGAR|nr:hypothetical protein GGX14DRAFT_454509 [Mycena pura]